MDDGSWLQNISQLGALPKLVVEKVCRAVGMVYKPVDIRVTAGAKADAIRSLAQAESDATDIRARASMRLETEQLRHQQNIEAITLKALPHLTEQAKPAEVEDDWLVNLFELARNASREDVQSLWARILAGEFNSPRSFSKRTLRLLADFDRRDAELFTALCRFALTHPQLTTPIIYEVSAPVYSELGITYDALVHLQNIGLIRFGDLTGFTLQCSQPAHTVVYFDTLMTLQQIPLDPGTPQGGAIPLRYTLPIGHVLLSNEGTELAKICGSTPVPGFVEYLVKRWEGTGIKCEIHRPIPG